MIVSYSNGASILRLEVIKDTVEYTKEQQLYQNLVPSGHTLLTVCIRIGTFDCFRVSGLV